MTSLEIPIDLVKKGSPLLGRLEYECKDCGKILTQEQFYDLQNNTLRELGIRSCKKHSFSVRRYNESI